MRRWTVVPFGLAVLGVLLSLVPPAVAGTLDDGKKRAKLVVGVRGQEVPAPCPAPWPPGASVDLTAGSLPP